MALREAQQGSQFVRTVPLTLTAAVAAAPAMAAAVAAVGAAAVTGCGCSRSHGANGRNEGGTASVALF